MENIVLIIDNAIAELWKARERFALSSLNKASSYSHLEKASELVEQAKAHPEFYPAIQE
ncbi:MAG: hypothetical protein ACYCQJ_12750 [Nitrososphaerales archaeon]